MRVNVLAKTLACGKSLINSSRILFVALIIVIIALYCLCSHHDHPRPPHFSSRILTSQPGGSRPGWLIHSPEGPLGNTCLSRMTASQKAGKPLWKPFSLSFPPPSLPPSPSPRLPIKHYLFPELKQ